MRIKNGERIPWAAEKEGFKTKRSGPVDEEQSKSVRSVDFVEVVPFFCSFLDEKIKQGLGSAQKELMGCTFDLAKTQKVEVELVLSDGGSVRDCAILVKSERGLKQEQEADLDLANCARAFLKASSGNCLWQLESGRVKSSNPCRNTPINPSCKQNKACDSSSLEQDSYTEIEKENWVPSMSMDASSSSQKSETEVDSLQIQQDLGKHLLQKRDYSAGAFGGLNLLADVAIDWIWQELIEGRKISTSWAERKRGFFIHGGCRFPQKKVNRGAMFSQIRHQEKQICDESALKIDCSGASGKKFVGSKRGRTPVLPGKFQDSVLSSWKKKTRK